MNLPNLLQDAFQCNDGWPDHFKARHNIMFRKICQEAAAVNSDVCEKWTTTRLPALLSSYVPCEVYNASETQYLLSNAA
jgi:hypothetical protein